MPSLGSERLRKIYLPSTKDEVNESDKGWVVMDTAFLAGTLMGADAFSDKVDQTAYVLSRAIREWNMTDPNTTVIAEINSDNIRKLDFFDFDYLKNQIGEEVEKKGEGLASDLKGPSSSTSAQ